METFIQLWYFPTILGKKFGDHQLLEFRDDTFPFNYILQMEIDLEMLLDESIITFPIYI